MTIRHTRTALTCCIGLASLVPSTASAQERGPALSLTGAAAAELPEMVDLGGAEEDVPAASVWLERPIGNVSTSQVGAELGPRRYAIADSRQNVKTISFSRHAAIRVGNWGGAMPTGLPIGSARVTSNFGVRVDPITGAMRAHSGVDFAAPAGTPIYATSDGVVTAASWLGGYGLAVNLNHGDGVETRYAHMSRIAVLAGQGVKKGEIIGFVGSTGRSTGAHLHYEVRRDARAINPFAR